MLDDLRGSQEAEVRMCLRHWDAFRTDPVKWVREKELHKWQLNAGGTQLGRESLPPRPAPEFGGVPCSQNWNTLITTTEREIWAPYKQEVF